MELTKLQNVRPAVHDVEQQLLYVGLERLVLLHQLGILILEICECVGVCVWGMYNYMIWDNNNNNNIIML